MVDLGLYNFIKNKRDAGETKEQVLQELASSGWNSVLIEEAWEAVAHKKVPQVSTPRESLRTRYSTNTSVGIFAILLVIIAGYFAFTEFQKHIGSLSISESATSSAQAVNGVLFYPYTQSEIGVIMSVPSDWQVSTTNGSDGALNGFEVTEQSNSDILSAQVTELLNTQLLSGVVTERSSALSSSNTVHIIQNADKVIGGQPGHIFEYTSVSGGQTTHTMEGYVLNKSGNLYEFLATSLDSDWNSVPATAMVNSISFTN